jgi:hypothetical protein
MLEAEKDHNNENERPRNHWTSLEDYVSTTDGSCYLFYVILLPRDHIECGVPGGMPPWIRQILSPQETYRTLTYYSRPGFAPGRLG